MELDFNELRELITAINHTDVTEFTLKSGEFELIVRKGIALSTVPQPLPDIVAPSLQPVPVSPPVGPAPSAAPPIPPTIGGRANERLLEVISPMVGTFYRAPAPDEDPYVNVGDRIKLGQVVCIVEAMKLMNEVESEVAGEIVEVLVENGQPVEFGQVLMRVNPG